MDILLLAALVTFAGACIVYLVLISEFIKNIKSENNQEWINLGSPQVFAATPAAAFRVVKMIWRTTAENSGGYSERVIKQARNLRIVQSIGILSGLATFFDSWILSLF